MAQSGTAGSSQAVSGLFSSGETGCYKKTVFLLSRIIQAMAVNIACSATC